MAVKLTKSMINTLAKACISGKKNFYDDIPEYAQDQVKARIEELGWVVNEDGTTSPAPGRLSVDGSETI